MYGLRREPKIFQGKILKEENWEALEGLMKCGMRWLIKGIKQVAKETLRDQEASN